LAFGSSTYICRRLLDQHFHEHTPSPCGRLHYCSHYPVSSNSNMRIAFSLDLGQRASWFNRIRVVVWGLVLLSSLSLVMDDRLPTWRTPTAGDVEVHNLTLWIACTNVVVAGSVYVLLHRIQVYCMIKLIMYIGLAYTSYYTKPVSRLSLSFLCQFSSRLLGLHLNIAHTNWKLTTGALSAMLGPCTGSV
jgi:hypothetical protein